MNLTPQQIATKFARKFGEVKAKNLLLKIFPSLENLSGKTLNLPQIIEDCHQSEARNFETAQRVDKRISNVSSMDKCATKRNQTWRHHPRRFDATRQNVGQV